jgi:hypothetical protein
MTINRGMPGSNHKVYDEIGRVTPNVEYCDSERPHLERIPAPWLPVQRYDKSLQHYIVISAGKVVAEDRSGNLVPAGLRKAFNVAAGSTVLSYTATDVTEGTIDLTTGVAVTVPVDYTQTDVTHALQERGLIKGTEYAMDFISKPIGIAGYNYWQACGPELYNPATYYKANWQPQSHPAITCDFCITLPVIPAAVTSETMANDNTGGAAGLLEDYLDGTQTRAAGWFTSTQIAEVTKYASEVTAGDDVVCYMFANFPLAHITDDTPITATGLTTRKSSIGALRASGDYYIDYDTGLLFLYEAGGDAIPFPFNVVSHIAYYHYNTAVSAAGNTYACATGDLNFGDLLTYDAASNFIKATLDISAAEGYDDSGSIYSTTDPNYGAGDDDDISRQIEYAVSNYVTGIVGQVIDVETYPRDYLDRVKTAYSGQTLATMKAPGSATGGRVDALSYAGGAEKMIVVNLIFR